MTDEALRILELDTNAAELELADALDKFKRGIRQARHGDETPAWDYPLLDLGL